jgi:hypothetical protein
MALRGNSGPKGQRQAKGKIIGRKLSVLGLLTFLALNFAFAQVTLPDRKSASTHRELFLEPSSTSVPGGRASLTIGMLTRQAETYVGDYQFKVSPYFFKNEKGKLSIDVPDETLKKLDRGMVVDFSGRATTSGSGKTRRIDGKAIPSDPKQGLVKLRFVAGKREMLFMTSYRFDEPRERSH